MVTKANILTRVDRNLETATAMVCDFPIVVEEWEEETIPNRMTWEMEWHEAMDRLYTVYKAREAGLLRPDQEERYQAVLRELKPQLPIVERLELFLPRFSLDG